MRVAGIHCVGRGVAMVGSRSSAETAASPMRGALIGEVSEAAMSTAAQCVSQRPTLRRIEPPSVEVCFRAASQSLLRQAQRARSPEVFRPWHSLIGEEKAKPTTLWKNSCSVYVPDIGCADVTQCNDVGPSGQCSRKNPAIIGPDLRRVR